MNRYPVLTLISGLVGIFIYSRVILPITYGLWNEIHEICVEQMAGAGFAEILSLVLADFIVAAAIMGGTGILFVAGTVTLVHRLTRG